MSGIEELSLEEIEKAIGHGGYGNVFLLKNHRPEAVIKLMECREDADVIFQKEYRTLEKLSHPNIVSYIGIREVVNRFGKKMGILMEYCQRGSLRTMIFNPRVIYSMNTVFVWMEELFNALDYLRRNDTIHRDLKPDNIFVTNDFSLKIGDFGSTKIAEATCQATLIGTYRYMSPQRIDEHKNVNGEISHRNDVYSLGLAAWEMVERRVVFSEYGTTFNHLQFWMDVYAKVITKVEDPKCSEDIQDLIKRCIDFDPSLRPIASEVNECLLQIRKSNKLLRELDFLPLIEEAQKELLRPIGFDGSTKRTPLYGFISDAPSICFETENGTQSKIQEETIEQETLRTRNFAKINLPVEDRNKFMARFATLSVDEKQSFIEKVPELLEKRKNERIIYHEFDHGAVKLGADGDSVEELFEAVVNMDIYIQMHEYHDSLQLLKEVSSVKFEFWKPHRMLSDKIEWLNDIRRTCYTQRIYFKCYISLQSNEEWLLLSKDDETYFRSSFIRKDLNVIKTFQGDWVKTPRKEVFACRNAFNVGLNDYRKERINVTEDVRELKIFEEFQYLGDEPIDFYMIIGAMERALARLENATRIQVSNFVPLENLLPGSATLSKTLGQDFPIPGYIFQLRNPPRSVCTCPIKCAPKGELPSFFEKSFHSNHGQQILFYECASEELMAYINNFHNVCSQFQRYSGMWAGSSRAFRIMDDISIFNEPFQLEGGRKKGQAKALMDYFFIFLQIPKVLPITSVNDFLVLMDHPSNYEPGERITCFDHNFDFFTMDAKVAATQLDQLDFDTRTFLVIDWARRGWIVKENGDVWKAE